MSNYLQEYCKVDRELLKRFADRLYTIGKAETTQHPALSVEAKSMLLNLAKMMYRTTKEQRTMIHKKELLEWSDALLQILEKIAVEDRGTEVYREIENINNRFRDWIAHTGQYEKYPIYYLDTLTSTSILLGSTLWFGGYNFSLSYEQLSSELSFNYNKMIESAYKRLKGDVFVELENKLIVLNPRHSHLVEKAILYLIGLGTGLKIIGPLSQKRQFSTIQEGFLILTRNKVHPMVPFFENARGYVSEYCQRFFGRLYDELERRDVKVRYDNLRRFVLRLSLLPLYNFVLSGDAEIKSIVETLETFGIVAKMPTVDSREAILIETEVLKY